MLHRCKLIDPRSFFVCDFFSGDRVVPQAPRAGDRHQPSDLTRALDSLDAYWHRVDIPSTQVCCAAGLRAHAITYARALTPTHGLIHSLYRTPCCNADARIGLGHTVALFPDSFYVSFSSLFSKMVRARTGLLLMFVVVTSFCS